MLGINQQDLSGDALDFIEEFDQSYPSIKDPQNDVARRWGATGIPETFFVDRRGRVVGHVIGAASSRQLRAGVAAAETGRVLPVREGGARQRAR